MEFGPDSTDLVAVLDSDEENSHCNEAVKALMGDRYRGQCDKVIYDGDLLVEYKCAIYTEEE